MIRVKRISHATFETPDVERQTDYYTGVVGLVPLSEDKDRVLFVSRLGDLSVILHRGTAPQAHQDRISGRAARRSAVARQKRSPAKASGRASTKCRCRAWRSS